MQPSPRPSPACGREKQRKGIREGGKEKERRAAYSRRRIRLISMRRLALRPSGVSLVATGLCSP